MILEYIKYGINKSTNYKANLISWFIADVSLYFSNFFSYYLLTLNTNYLFGMKSTELLLYISTYTLTNNIFSIFFAESISDYSEKIESGEIAYNILYPINVQTSCNLFNFNFAACLSTIFLFGINIYLLTNTSFSIINIIIYYLYIILSVLCLKHLFYSIQSIKFFRIKSDSLSGLIFSILSIGEKPDKIFTKKVKGFLTFIIPAFIMSAIPYSFLKLKTFDIYSLIYIMLPIIWFILNKLIFNIGKNTYQCDF